MALIQWWSGLFIYLIPHCDPLPLLLLWHHIEIETAMSLHGNKVMALGETLITPTMVSPSSLLANHHHHQLPHSPTEYLRNQSSYSHW